MEEGGAISGRRGHERLEEPPRVVAQHRLRPPDGRRGIAVEVFDREHADHCQIMVAGKAQVGLLLHDRTAAIRLGAVPDDVAETPDLVGRLGGHLCEDCLESVIVPVDV